VVIRAWRAIVKNNEQKLEVSLGSGLEVDETGTYVQLKVKEGKSTFYIRERSLGFRWFFGFILFTHFRTYRDNSRRNALFLLDEPASNLHPAAQTKLLSAFNALPNNQLVVYSTHSHHMIKPEWLAGAYVVWNAGHSYEGLDLAYNASMTDVKAQRYFQFVSSRPNDTDLYRPILDALDYSPGPLEMIPDIVIVEGKNDWYTLKYAADVLRLHTGNSPHFYPSTGKDKTDGIVAQYLGWGRRFVVLLDADKGGRDTRERLLRQFGEIVRDRVFTLADVDASWCELEMEDLFEQAERDSITETAFPGERYVKSKFNAAVAALLIRCEEIELSQGTAERLRKLLAFVGQKLGT
jgi:5S rRNA maturation endonuclease (ribonuclease M5)